MIFYVKPGLEKPLKVSFAHFIIAMTIYGIKHDTQLYSYPIIMHFSILNNPDKSIVDR